MGTKRLGRGLDALLPSLDITENDQVVQIPLKELRANPYQPRKTFTDESLRELADSIREHGVIQPIIVRKVLRGYEIIAGERRFRAAQMNRLDTIPAVIRDFTDQEVMEIALIENVQREDLNALEIAMAYQQLIDTFSLTQEELAARVGKSRPHIANFLRLLQLPDKIKEHVSRGTISMGHARALAGVQDKKEQERLAETVVRENWSVRELEEAIQKSARGKQTTARKKKIKTDPYIQGVEEQLQEVLQTTVRIKTNKTGGKIEISYYSPEELDRLLERLQGR